MRKRSQGSRVTLEEVARVADVSNMTVSRVLRNVGAVSEDMRERVLRAVKSTGYVHNRLAGALASASSSLFGVIMPTLSNSVFPELMTGISAALAHSGYQPVVGMTDHSLETEEKLVRSMLAWQPAAMIVTGQEHSRETSRMLDASGIRVIEIMDTDGRPIDLAIGYSHRKAGAAMARHLMAKGYRRFAYVGHDIKEDVRAGVRQHGFLDVLEENDISLAGSVLIDAPSSIQLGRAGMKKLLDQKRSLDVVVFANDELAVGAQLYCIEKGISVPGDLAIFGFGGLDIGQAMPRKLSTIKSNREEIGQLSVQAFLDAPVRPAERRVIDTGFAIVTGETA